MRMAAGLDPTIAAGLWQALGTVLAVIVGFGLSLWSQQVSASRERERDLRDRQRTALVGLLEALTAQQSSTSAVFETLQQSLGPSAGSAAGTPAQRSALKFAMLAAEPDLVAARSASRTLNRHVLEITLLGCPESLVKRANHAKDRGAALSAEVDAIVSGGSRPSGDSVLLLQALGKSIQELVAEGVGLV